MARKRSTHGPRHPLIRDEEIFAQICERKVLEDAWGKVWRNGGAAGGDRVTIHDFARRAHMLIGLLAGALREGRYQPGPLRNVEIPKTSGGVRQLTIPCVGDRIVQTAVTTMLAPHLEAEFEETSFGYRPGRSIYQAVAMVQALQREGLTHVIDADVDDFFDSVPHDALLARLRESLTDGPLGELISLWLADWNVHGKGLAQGSPLSPLLANLYLDRLDEAFSGEHARIVRFADDFLILTASREGAEVALDKVDRMLKTHGLSLNRDKTRVTDFDRGFQFLGHRFVRSMALKVSPEESDVFAASEILSDLARRDALEEENAEAEAATLAGQEKRGYSPGLRNLYILEPDRRLSIRNQAFTVEELAGKHDPLTGAPADWRELIAIPHQQIDRIDIGPKGTATPAALDHALSTNTIVCFVDGHGATTGTLAPSLAPRAKRHLAQAATTLDPAKQLALARILVEGRLRNQRALLRKLSRDRVQTPAPVTKAVAELTRLIGRGDTSRIRHARSVDQAMGYEGSGAAAYWRALSALAHKEFRFDRRQRRQADPANIALNFLAWLLHRDVSVCVLSAGLHPGFGALHAADDQRDACVYDLMEEFRAHMVEGLFVYLTNRRILQHGMFRKTGDCWRMARTGSSALIRAYEARASATIAWPKKTRRTSFRRMMLEQTHALARHHETGEQYTPFEIDY